MKKEFRQLSFLDYAHELLKNPILLSQTMKPKDQQEVGMYIHAFIVFISQMTLMEIATTKGYNYGNR